MGWAIQKAELDSEMYTTDSFLNVYSLCVIVLCFKALQMPSMLCDQKCVCHLALCTQDTPCHPPPTERNAVLSHSATIASTPTQGL